VITRPDPEQVLTAVRCELRNKIAPRIDDPALSVTLQMIDNILQNVATRAMHEIAWMREECDAIEAAVAAVLETLPDAPTAAALEAYRTGRTASLHHDVRADYDRATEALSCALEATIAHGDRRLTAPLVALLHQRNTHELQIMGDWGFVGRG
jgi:hypothetical protein